MIYTVLTCQDLTTGQVLDLEKKGNVYNINFMNNQTIINVEFKTIEEAKEKYLKIVECFINCYYTFEDRIKILRGEI